MRIGRVAALYRYPVKSMAGEALPEVELGPHGIPGDRAWAARDEVRGGIRGAKKIPGLMRCTARYLEAPQLERVPAPEIELPDGARLLASDPDAAERVSKAVDHPITLWPLQPADALDHYRRGPPDDPDLMRELRAIFAREADEPLPDLGRFPPDLLRYESPPGSYFDAFPLLLLSDASLARLAAARPESRFDVRRFRPNLLVTTEAREAAGGPFPELGWIGKELRIGGAVVAVEMECPRCVMTTHRLADLPEDPGIMRALVREAAGNLGVYASVRSPGVIRAGDAVRVAG